MAGSHTATVLSLCSGVGGLELGLSRAIRTHVLGYCERDPFAASVLLARMEEEALEPAPIYCGDLGGLDLAPYVGSVDVVTAGYPCQPFSHAGRRDGEDDDRHLWPEILRVVREVGARVLVAENVRGHLSLGFDRVLSDLADAGFDAEWATVRAAEAGAPHKRERLFIVAYAANVGHERPWNSWRRRTGPQDEGVSLADAGRECDERRGEPGVVHGAQGAPRIEGGQPHSSGGSSRDQGADVADGDGGRRCVADGRGDRIEGRRREAPVVGNAERPRLEERRAGSLPRSFPATWPPSPSGDWGSAPEWCHPATESVLRRVADGVPSDVELAQEFRVDRLRTLGNAVCPAQAASALTELLDR